MKNAFTSCNSLVFSAFSPLNMKTKSPWGLTLNKNIALFSYVVERRFGLNQRLLQQITPSGQYFFQHRSMYFLPTTTTKQWEATTRRIWRKKSSVLISKNIQCHRSRNCKKIQVNSQSSHWEYVLYLTTASEERSSRNISGR